MNNMTAHASQRLDLVTACHHFLLKALPLAAPQSQIALETLVVKTLACKLPTADIDAVLLRCLRVMDRHAGGRLPTMVDMYLTKCPQVLHSLTAFRSCVEDLLRYRAVVDPKVQRVVAMIEAGYGNPKLRQSFIAKMVGARQQWMCAAFKTHTGFTFTEYLRNVRLNRAAALLISNSASIKEVWTSVGYNHPSNFDHDFKRRFGVAPSEYRARGISTSFGDDRQTSTERPNASPPKAR